MIGAMPQSLAAVHLHAVFSTKNRSPYLADEGLRKEVHAYLGGVSNKLGCPAVCIGGVEDHVHLLARMSRTVTVAEWIKEVKRVSSMFIAERNSDFAWQGGYGVFSVSASELEAVTAYITNQEDHHRRVSFQDEFLGLLREHGVEWDERFVWD